jgi:hypothetical protein
MTNPATTSTSVVKNSHLSTPTRFAILSTDLRIFQGLKPHGFIACLRRD